MGKKTKFLDELEKGEREKVEVFVTQVYETVIYFCENCKKKVDKMCECGNFPEPELKISGVISDGSKTLPFQASKEVSQKWLEHGKDKEEKERVRKLMSSPHILEGKIRKNKFFVKDIE